MINLKRVGWENGALVESAKVLADGTVQPAQYEGSTPLSANNLKAMEDNTEEALNEIDSIVCYQGTCTDEELEQAIEDINKDTNKVLKDKNNKILDFIVPRYENDEGTGYIKIGNLKICWGIVNTTYVNPNVMNADITFPITFENAPNVQLTLNGTNNVAEELDENAKVTNVTSTGAAVYVHSKNGEFSGGWQQNVNWLAIGY